MGLRKRPYEVVGGKFLSLEIAMRLTLKHYPIPIFPGCIRLIGKLNLEYQIHLFPIRYPCDIYRLPDAILRIITPFIFDADVGGNQKGRVSCSADREAGDEM